MNERYCISALCIWGEKLEETVSFQGDEIRGLDVSEPVCELVLQLLVFG